MYVIFSILSSPPCEPKWDEKEVKQLIENIENKMILDKLETFYCAYSVIIDYYDLHSKLVGSSEVKEIHEVTENEIAWIGKIGKQDYFYHSCIHPLIFSQKDQTPIPPSSPKETDNPSGSLLGPVKPKLEEQEQNYYKYNQSEQQQGKKLVAESFVQVIYDKKPYGYRYLWYESRDFEITKSSTVDNYSPPPIYFFEFFGQLGPGAYSYRFNWGQSFISFLKSPGPYYVSKEGDYIKLWHYAEIDELKPQKSSKGYEVWVDADYKIFRIDEVSYPSRTLDKSIFSEYKYEGPVDCDNPRLLDSRIQFEEYLDFPENLYLPVRVSIERYNADPDNELSRKIETEFREGKISQYERLFALAKIPYKVDTRLELEMYKDKVEVNKPLSQEFFNLRKTPDLGIDNREKRHSGIILFISGCVVFTLLAMFITRRYSVWGA